jgi:hypothetical protein
MLIYILDKMELDTILYLHKDIKKYRTKVQFEAALFENKIVWNEPGRKVYYNNIIAFTELGYDIDIQFLNKKAYILFKNIINTNMRQVCIPIKKQDYFQYKFIRRLYQYSIRTDKKYKDHYNFLQKYFNHKYTNDEYYKMEDANIINYGKGGYRIDFLLHLENKDSHGKQYWYIIEFFELAHLKKTDPGFSIEKNRLNSLRCDNSNTNKEFASIAIYWERFLDNKEYFTKWCKYIITIIKSFQNINNEEYWCIKELHKTVELDKNFAKMIYDSSQYKNNPVIPLDRLDKVIFPKSLKNKSIDKLHKLFFDNCSKRTKFKNNIIENNDNILLLSDGLDISDDDMTQGASQYDYERNILQPVIEIIYYKIDDSNNINLTDSGLTLYISIINSQPDLVKNNIWIEHQTKINNALVTAIKKQRDNMLSITTLNNIAYGLEDIYIEHAITTPK